MASKITRRTAAFDVEAIRRQMYERVAPPSHLLQKAFTRLDEQLDATRTEFFSFQGSVVEKREVVDHGTRGSAIDKVMKVAGAYAHESDKPKAPTVALRIDPVTGVMELVIGTSPEGGAYEVNNNNGDSGVQLAAHPDQLALPLYEPEGHLLVDGKDEDEPQVIKHGRGRMPKHITDLLFKDG